MTLLQTRKRQTEAAGDAALQKTLAASCATLWGSAGGGSRRFGQKPPGRFHPAFPLHIETFLYFGYCIFFQLCISQRWMLRDCCGLGPDPIMGAARCTWPFIVCCCLASSRWCEQLRLPRCQPSPASCSPPSWLADDGTGKAAWHIHIAHSFQLCCLHTVYWPQYLPLRGQILCSDTKRFKYLLCPNLQNPPSSLPCRARLWRDPSHSEATPIALRMQRVPLEAALCASPASCLAVRLRF